MESKDVGSSKNVELSAPESSKESLNADMKLRERELLLQEQRITEELELRRVELQLKRDELDFERATRKGWWSRLEKSLALAIPIFIALIAPSFSLIQYGWSQQAAAEAQAQATKATAELEARKAFNAKQVELYEKTIRTTGTLLTTPLDSDEYKKAQEAFEILYWAELPLVEHPIVERAMVSFRRCLFRIENISPKDCLDERALALSQAIRASLNELYQIRTPQGGTNQ